MACTKTPPNISKADLPFDPAPTPPDVVERVEIAKFMTRTLVLCRVRYADGKEALSLIEERGHSRRFISVPLRSAATLADALMKLAGVGEPKGGAWGSWSPADRPRAQRGAR